MELDDVLALFAKSEFFKFPQPKVEWLINGESLIPSDNVEIKGSTLLISEVEKKHAGIVQCVASNEYGSHSGCNLLRVNPKQHIGTTEIRQDYGISNSKHKHTRGGGRRRSKEGKHKGTGNWLHTFMHYYLYIIIIYFIFMSCLIYF